MNQPHLPSPEPGTLSIYFEFSASRSGGGGKFEDTVKVDIPGPDLWPMQQPEVHRFLRNAIIDALNKLGRIADEAVAVRQQRIAEAMVEVVAISEGNDDGPAASHFVKILDNVDIMVDVAELRAYQMQRDQMNNSRTNSAPF